MLRLMTRSVSWSCFHLPSSFRLFLHFSMSSLHSLTCFIFPLLPYYYPEVTAAFSLSVSVFCLSYFVSFLSLQITLCYRWISSFSTCHSLPLCPYHPPPLSLSHYQSHFPVPLRRLSPHTTILSIPYPCLSLRLFFFPSPYIISRWLVAVTVRLERLVGDYMLLWDFEPYFMDVTRSYGIALLFTSTGWGYVSELRPPTGPLFILQMIYGYGERRWNDVDTENRTTPRKPCPSATLYTTNSTWTDPGANPGLRCERPATRNGHGRIFMAVCTYFWFSRHSTMVLHAHISPGGWTIGPLVAAVLRRSLTPSTWSSRRCTNKLVLNKLI
jgi:hypothetical protein